MWRIFAIWYLPLLLARNLAEEYSRSQAADTTKREGQDVQGSEQWF
jgi:hypothetical protein